MGSISLIQSIKFLERNNVEFFYEGIYNDPKEVPFVRNTYIKVSFEEFTHKTELGGLFKINSREDFENFLESSKILMKKYKIDGFLLQKKVSGFELIISLINHEIYGRVFMVGSGGLLTEVYKDVVYIPEDFNRCILRKALKRIKIGRIFEGFRNKSVKIEFLENALNSLKNIKENFKVVEINPAIINENGIYFVDIRVEI